MIYANKWGLTSIMNRNRVEKLYILKKFEKVSEITKIYSIKNYDNFKLSFKLWSPQTVFSSSPPAAATVPKV